ncbi:hypothetical protein [Cryptosporangium sp. NPDC048952]|uniref:hypothetical protein n=1 Tax=Cryptosporangium sp. NPDC048952 TaxID=3363961 RepID=UPI00371ABCAF
MRISASHPLRIRLLDALTTGSVRIDAAHGGWRGDAQLTAVGADRTVYWITQTPDLHRTHLVAVRPPGSARQPVTGSGCDPRGFRLLGTQPHLVAALIASCPTPPGVVRGDDADFAGLTTDPVISA